MYENDSSVRTGSPPAIDISNGPLPSLGGTIATMLFTSEFSTTSDVSPIFTETCEGSAEKLLPVMMSSVPTPPVFG